MRGASDRIDDNSDRNSDEALQELEALLGRMDVLGIEGENAAARVCAAIPLAARNGSNELADAIGDVLEIISERSRLAHQAHRLIAELRKMTVAAAAGLSATTS